MRVPRFLLLACGLFAAAPAVAAQAPDAPLSRILFGSCADQDRPLPIFESMVAAKPELLVLLGDNIYADLDKSKAVTTEVIKEKYAVLADLPGWKKLRAACPVVATWDDHDYGKNDAGAEWPLKDESQRVFLDFMGVPADSPLRSQKGIYNAHVYGPPGKRTQVILLDTRYFRSPLVAGSPVRYGFPDSLVRKPWVADTTPGVTMLGDAQWKWLADQLKVPAELRLLCSSVQAVEDEHPFEKWGNMPAERARLLDLIRDSKASGVVVLSGDRHLAELAVEPAAVGYPLYDLTSSGFNQGTKSWRLTGPSKKRIASMPFGDNFGAVLVDWSADDPRITLQIRDEDGDVTIGHKLRLSALKAGSPLLAAKATTTTADPPKEEAKLPEGVIKPEDALKKVGEKVTVQFAVAGGRAVSEGKRILLNSEKDFRSEKNLTVVVNAKAMTGPYEKATYDTFKGKTVRATGTVKEFNKTPQVVIDDAKDLELVEEKKEGDKKEPAKE